MSAKPVQILPSATDPHPPTIPPSPRSPHQLKALAPRPAKDCAKARTCMFST